MATITTMASATSAQRSDHNLGQTWNNADSVIQATAPCDAMVGLWADAAVSLAVFERIEDPDGLVATVPGARGAWGFGPTRSEAIAELRSALADWAAAKLEDGDDDIPSMKGVQL